MDYCCKKFAKQAGKLQAPAGGGFLYPPGMIPKAQFVQGTKGRWHINGCCGGGCYVVTDMKFCPYCGKRLKNGTKSAP